LCWHAACERRGENGYTVSLAKEAGAVDIGTGATTCNARASNPVLKKIVPRVSALSITLTLTELP
jgi:hypothetical protein